MDNTNAEYPLEIADFIERGWHMQCEGRCGDIIKGDSHMTTAEIVELAEDMNWRVSRGGHLLCGACKAVKIS